MKVFNTDTNRPALRWASSQERRNAALLAVPFGILGAIGAATVPFLLVRPGTPGGLDTVVIFALGAVAIALVAVSLIVYSAARARFLERQETAAREAVEEAVAELQDELTLKALMQINRKQIEAYHLLTRHQATEAYRNSVDFEQPLQTNYLLAAERLIDRLGEARRDRLRIKVIDHMLGATEQSARLLTLTGVGDGAHSNGSTPADGFGRRNGRTPAGRR